MTGRMLPLGKGSRGCMDFFRITRAYVTPVIPLQSYGISLHETLHLSAFYWCAISAICPLWSMKRPSWEHDGTQLHSLPRRDDGSYDCASPTTSSVRP